MAKEQISKNNTKWHNTTKNEEYICHENQPRWRRLVSVAVVEVYIYYWEGGNPYDFTI
jgi:hypothetical protein